MAMTARLFTISALATDLDRDRRTIAAALRGVPPDGKSGRFDAWLLSTAMLHLDRRRADGHKPKSKIGEHFFGRLCEWRQIRKECGKDTPRHDAHWMEENFGASREDVLTWLRAGLPFAVEGDWETGEGFEFISYHVIDWHLLLNAALYANSDEVTAKRLALIGA
jgi:hypothetical protein